MKKCEKKTLIKWKNIGNEELGRRGESAGTREHIKSLLAKPPHILSLACT